jgi:hypothetical protein
VLVYQHFCFTSRSEHPAVTILAQYSGSMLLVSNFRSDIGYTDWGCPQHSPVCPANAGLDIELGNNSLFGIVLTLHALHKVLAWLCESVRHIPVAVVTIKPRKTVFSVTYMLRLKKHLSIEKFWRYIHTGMHINITVVLIYLQPNSYYIRVIFICL